MVVANYYPCIFSWFWHKIWIFWKIWFVFKNLGAGSEWVEIDAIIEFYDVENYKRVKKNFFKKEGGGYNVQITPIFLK